MVRDNSSAEITDHLLLGLLVLLMLANVDTGGAFGAGHDLRFIGVVDDNIVDDAGVAVLCRVASNIESIFTDCRTRTRCAECPW